MLENEPAHKSSRFLGRILLPVTFVVVWEISARGLDLYLFPPASRVFSILLHPLRSQYAQGSLFTNTLISVVRVSIGFLTAALVGVSMGLLMGSVRPVRYLLEPFLELLRPLCPIAWIPFAIAMFKMTSVTDLFGLRYHRGILSQVQLGMLFVLFWGGFFPILLNTLDGVAHIRRNYVTLARTLGSGPWQTYIHVHLPAAMPMILTGLRQGVGMCWFVLIAAEMLPGTNSGIGYLLIYASDLSAMDLVLTAMLIIGSIGALLNSTLLWTTRALVRWHGKEV